MRIELSLSREAECDLPEQFFREVAETTLRLSGSLSGNESISIGVAFVSLERIKELNRAYRGKNRETDVLSFGEFRRKVDIPSGSDQEIFLGDLVLSPEFIASAAREDRVSFQREMAFIFSHGILHLLGFRHSPKMFSIQDHVVSVHTQ